MAQGSKPGERRGGRKPGTPNKLTSTAQSIFHHKRYDPLVSMIKEAKAIDKKPPSRRDLGETKRLDRLNKELIPYLHPKLSTVTHQGDESKPLSITIKYDQ